MQEPASDREQKRLTTVSYMSPQDSQQQTVIPDRFPALKWSNSQKPAPAVQMRC
ncbi:hypothetical protein BaRGS_00032018 [Batillaria attramentaria]|uniref:Uncharacterized protein n=1 Tax=Batillaria attramentaria TaxID=370345 RepID=A0ABD0JPS5_9CAEN